MSVRHHLSTHEIIRAVRERAVQLELSIGVPPRVLLREDLDDPVSVAVQEFSERVIPMMLWVDELQQFVDINTLITAENITEMNSDQMRHMKHLDFQHAPTVGAQKKIF